MFNEEQKNEIFSTEQHLTLQQLLTLQNLAEKTIFPSTNVDEDHDKQLDAQGSAIEESYRKWRLLSDEVQLHVWQEKCLSIWLENGFGTVKVATGGGKTVFALAAAQKLQNTLESDLRLVIIVPTIPLMHQWLGELTQANIPPARIALMGGGQSPSDDPNIRILICVLNSARDRLPALVNRFNWSSRLLLVVDECHRANASEARKIFDTDPKYTLGLSATPEDDAGDSFIPTDEAYALSEVGKGLGPIIFEFSLRESMAAGLLTPFEVWHVGLSLTPKEGAQYAKLSREISSLRKDLQIVYRRSKSRLNFIPWCQSAASREGVGDASRFIGLANERKRMIYKASARSELTLKILSTAMRERNRRAIVFHESIEDINNLFIAACDKKIPAVLEHSKLPASIRAANIDAFRRGVARTIISAKSLVEGFNVPSADLGIIAASSGSVRQRIQSLGRMLRKKDSDETAIVFILYVKDTEDEAIYQRADWEAVVGAERNRYFEWSSETGTDLSSCTLAEFTSSFKETGSPPRVYRPPCHELDTSALTIGDEYLAQTKGVELRVDQSGNLRADDKAIVRASKETIEKIIQTNQNRRAVRTSCGHLVCRTGIKNGPEAFWIYLGIVDGPEEPQEVRIEKLLVKSASGRRVISKKEGRNEIYARGPERASSSEAGITQKLLIEWICQQERKFSVPIREIYSNFDKKFWIEINGERVEFKGALSALEFPQ